MAAARSSTPGGRPKRRADDSPLLPAATPTKPGSATLPLPSIARRCVDQRRPQRRRDEGVSGVRRPLRRE